ncbi:MAG: ABC transporter ATP-binding protein [Candidatus Heimdallarchaeota archaeon]|nr:MAG: ABC transporter ATP-binding protein [Candidatus Heimdallarchaeota archaeon]
MVIVEDVHREFTLGDHIVQALRGVSMEIYEGEFVVVLGPSGSGKTTLLNQIGGIDSPTKGTVTIKGDEITKWKAGELGYYRRHNVGWIFQFFNLIPSLRAWENTGLALEFSGDRKDLKERACKMLEAVGLGDKVDRFPSQLSGGEQQRVAIARALVKNPSIVVADEPTGNLDFITGQKIANLMNHLNKTFGGTYIVVSHDLSITEKADRVFHLRDGRIESVEDHS